MGRKIAWLLIVISIAATAAGCGINQKAQLSDWGEVKLITPYGFPTMSFTGFTFFDNRLDPHVVYVIDGKGINTKAFQALQFPPTYNLSWPLKHNSVKYANIMVVQIPKDVAERIKTANKVSVVFFKNDQPDSYEVPDAMLKDWQSKL